MGLPYGPKKTEFLDKSSINIDIFPDCREALIRGMVERISLKFEGRFINHLSI